MATAEKEPENSIDKEASIIGPEYKVIFAGEGWVSSGQDDGSFISRNSFKESDEEWARYFEQEAESPSAHAPKNRILLDMAGLFPPEWRESKVEFEITVKAKKIPQE